ncbi:hypothetical protein A1O3_06073 [Capronia epimyces CBS 606.96]|uniref:Major facilitator superfamily (MFS) profile domain-containing protein n=1 Tax=Capronia epimyces CBS 606.96 TaxID=1182542 RepID=W9XY01_9EURO|nr:uncharacterized protein A1O3_06073 [Capronia epimyces CBS 606.96]EXJ82260.1 hypothetical protein A1O3_06073 [Capronia epimyces CBS 606.96]
MALAPLSPDPKDTVVVAVNHEHAAETKARAEAAAVARSGEAVLRDDPEARAAFLASFSAADEKRIMRKVDRRFLLLIGLMYMVKQIDVTNAASVKVLQVGQPSNILKELHMTPDQYNWVQSIYYISYIIFETPSNLILKRMSPHVWQSRIFFTWGIVLACHAAIQNRQGYYAVRFILGMMEAGFFPGVMCQMAFWYRTEEYGKPVMWLFAISQAAGVVGSLLCYGISYMDGIRGLSAWRWVYLLEGLATILFSVSIYFLLPDYPKSPRSDRWLTKREQEFIETRLSENAPLTSDPAFSSKEIWASLKNPNLWSFMGMQMFVNLANYGLTWYLPTITTSLGFAKLPKNQLLNIPPAVSASLGVVGSYWFIRGAYISRPLWISILMLCEVVCFILFFTISNHVGIYIACILGTMFGQAFFINFWAWRSSTLKGSTGTAFVLGFQNCVGQVGGVVAPQYFVQKWAYNRYKNSFAIATSFLITAFFFAQWTWWLTRNVEADVLRVARLRKAAKKEGRVYAEDDIKVFEERKYDSAFWSIKKFRRSNGVARPEV